jgi:hypothetical protein
LHRDGHRTRATSTISLNPPGFRYNPASADALSASFL